MQALALVLLLFVSATADPLVREAVVNRLNTYDLLAIPFFKGIVQGNLSPYCYTRMLVQDNCYFESTTLLWETVRTMAKNDPEFMEFCNMKYQEMRMQTKQSRELLSMNQFGGKANEATLSYTQDQRATVVGNNAYYSLLANYACSQTWPYIAQKLKPLTRKENNPYYLWIDENQSFVDALQYEQMIAKYQDKFGSGWISIVERMVDHQIAFFRAACPEQTIDSQ